VTARDAYDPFGKRRFANGNYDAAGTLGIDWSTAVNSGTDRGFTGHEQLDDIGLTHMNGRIYDVALGRFLSGTGP
jgi:RHS repeat-associated protein